MPVYRRPSIPVYRAINQRNQQQSSAPAPQFAHIFGHFGQKGSEVVPGETCKSFNPRVLLVGLQGFEPRTKGL